MDEIKNRKIILDTCILIYALEKDKTIDILSNLSKDNILLYSAISGFEVLKNRQDHTERNKYLKLINTLNRIPIDSPILMNAATLYYLYKKGGKIGNSKAVTQEMIDYRDRLTGDLIIAGTALSYEDHLILTSNKKDFPEPFWTILQADQVGEESNRVKIYLLEPNMAEFLKGVPDQQVHRPSDAPFKEEIYDYRG